MFIFNAVILVGFIVFVTRLVAGQIQRDKKLDAAKGPFTFEVKPILDSDETFFCETLNAVVPAVFGPEARILPKVSLNSFLKGNNTAADTRLAGLTADFLITTREGKILCAVDYRTDSHYGGSKGKMCIIKDDDFKQEATEAAGLSYEFVSGMSTKAGIQVILNNVRKSHEKDAPTG
jgi:hypothetical protein